MAFEIVLNEEYTKKLKKARMLSKFEKNIISFLRKVRNMNGQRLTQKIVDEYVEGLNKVNNFKSFCVFAFDWPDTPEGVEVWESIAMS